MSCCDHANEEHNTLGSTFKMPHCEGCCREACQDYRYSWRPTDDKRPHAVAMRHLHTFEPDGQPCPGKADIRTVGLDLEMVEAFE